MTGREAGGTLGLGCILVGLDGVRRRSRHTEEFLAERVSCMDDMDLLLGLHCRLQAASGGGPLRLRSVSRPFMGAAFVIRETSSFP